ncbi:MAG TPA: NAD(P)-dependent alcohol dehydrogenase [bacterium]|nr:NAD(P)-dependent alcohol dehydrogenase [bacterium]
MKAALLTPDRKIVVEELPEPEISKGNEIMVRVRCVGICGSDVHYFRYGRIGDQVVRDRIILGHEASGEVVAVGQEVEKLKVGDRVAIEPSISCGDCPQCRKGKPNLCPRVLFLGTPPVDGALREFLVMPESNLVKLPEGVTYAEGALAEPLAIGLYAVRLSCFRPGDSVLVIGAGPIGLSVVFAAASLSRNLVVRDLLPWRLEMAKLLGATEVVLVSQERRSLSLRKDEELFDVVFEAAGKEETFQEATRNVRVGGNMVLIGIPDKDEVGLNPHLLRRKEVLVTNVRRSAHTTEMALQLVAQHRGLLNRMITHTFPLQETERALSLVGAYGDGVVKAMIEL